VLVLLTLLGLTDGVRWLRPAVWGDTLQFDGLALRHELSIVALDHDEIPYYQRIIDEERSSKWIGRPSGIISPSCRTEREPWSLGLYPQRDVCAHLSPESVQWMVEVGMPESEGPVEDEAFGQVAMGRGLWIRSNRDMARFEEAIGLLNPAVADRMREGARDEARRYGVEVSGAPAGD